jgi:ribosomal protein L11 methyltransferase
VSEWLTLRCFVPTRQVPEVEHALAAAALDAWAMSGLTDEGATLELWVASREEVAPYEAVLGSLGLTFVDEERVDSSTLSGERAGPVTLCEGVFARRPDEDAPAGALSIVVPASAAFGDGSHPTTRLAAELLCALPLAGARVLDVGCGTGVLGALAAARGARTVALADIDEASLVVAREVIAANDVDATVVRSDLLADVPSGPWDVIVANVWADLAVRLLEDERLDALLPSGTLLLSGIARSAEADVVRAAVGAGRTVSERLQASFWCALRLSSEP